MSDENDVEALADLKALREWLHKHRPDREGGTGLSAQAWMDLIGLFLDARTDARRAAGEQIARAIEAEAADWHEANLPAYGVAAREAARIAREVTK